MSPLPWDDNIKFFSLHLKVLWVMLKSLIFNICRTVFQRPLAWWTKLSVGSVVIIRVSLPGRLGKQKMSKSAIWGTVFGVRYLGYGIGVRYFKTL